MVIGCFVVGGGLMFLIFYSARKGYDDAVHHGRGGRDPGPKLSVLKGFALIAPSPGAYWQRRRQRRIDRALTPAASAGLGFRWSRV